MSDKLEAETLQELLELNNPHAVNSILEEAHPQDIAGAAEGLDDAALWQLLRQLDPGLRGDVFARLDIARQVELINRHPAAESADLLEAMASDDRVDLVQRLDESTRAEVMRQMEEPQRRDVERLAEYEQGTAGAVMSTEVATLRSDMTVEQALRHIRTMAAQKETIYYNYVVDPSGKLLGIASLRELVLAEPKTPVTDVMSTEVISAAATEPLETVARTIREYDLLALPVLSEDKRLVGIVTVDDVMDVAEAEATEDFHKLGATGVGGSSIKDAGLFFLFRRRIVWLSALVFVNLLSGAGIAAFEETIEKVVALVFFLPLLIGSGGNAGSQAATLMVRALATGEVVMKDWLRMLIKEFGVALALGATMAVAVGLVSAWRAPHVIMVVSTTMVLLVLTGSLIGMSLPFIFTRLKLDPATASGPLVTSLADISGVLIYFGLATWMLRDHLAVS